MAIKTVSQINKFQNGDIKGSSAAGHGKLGIGKNLTFFSDGYLTTLDKQCALPADGSNHSSLSYGNYYSSGRNTNSSLQINDGITYWSSLFEISRPESQSRTVKPEDESEFNSYSLQYEDLLKNILWDVKSYLNVRNNLNDYNLSAIVEGNQYFKGSKYLIGDLSVSNKTSTYHLSAQQISSQSLKSYHLSAVSISAKSLSTYNLSAHNEFVRNLSVDNKLVIGNNLLSVAVNNHNIFWDGYAFGLKDNPTTHTNVGTYLSNITTGFSNQLQRRGDPVCFKDGRPYELTCVNYANKAYNLIKNDGSLWNVGKGEIRTVAGITTNTSDTSNYKAVYFLNGQPRATNVIDFAEHAYWSDLGERYLADSEYEPGTLVKFGGEKEITIADDEVNAIVSTKAFDLNAGLEGGTVIALCGRVPTKVKGAIKKFDKVMLSDTPGIACKWDGHSRVIGRALESNNNENIKLVECVTQFII